MIRIVDLFCGIGGVAEAVRSIPSASVVSAIDIDRKSSAVYHSNHGIRPICRTLESITEIPEADLWWLSPPCQPYTRRGVGRAENDPRSHALSHLIDLIGRDQPALLAVENVPEFAGSPHHQTLTNVLEHHGYSIAVDLRCPTQWGVPMRRNRFYLRGSRLTDQIPDLCPEAKPRPLADFLDESAWDDSTLHLSDQIMTRYRTAMNVIDTEDALATAACFTSAYGKSPVRAGSYLHSRRRKITRRFSPAEISWLMGFSKEFQWPDELQRRECYSMIGNSLSVTVSKDVLQSFIPKVQRRMR